MINRDRSDLSRTRQCKLLKISRTSLYFTPVGVGDETLKLMTKSTGCSQNTRSLAVGKLQHTCLETVSMLAAIACAA